jgi:3-phenylpropionate/trans-cinnamate dioxygenase ferredoxin reductase subunit
VTAAKILREQGAEGAVAILAAESLLPYHRPPLTKGFLLGKRPHASLLVLNEAYFRDHGVQVLLGTRALAGSSPANTLIMRKLLIRNLLHDKGSSVQVVDIECLILNQNISG